MKAIEITKTIHYPDKCELEAVGQKNYEPIKPRSAIIVTVFVYGYKYSASKEELAVYECLKSAEGHLRNQIASDVVVAYCEAHGIKWGSINGGMTCISHHCEHFVIEAAVELRENAE